jgi:O-antigen/teichoic acid export membrane protein
MPIGHYERSCNVLGNENRRSFREIVGAGSRPGRLVQNAIALMISSGGTAVIGVVFWAVAAHLASKTAVGRTTAEIAAMLLLANLAQLSFGSIFERFLPVAGSMTRDFVKRAYITVVIVGFVLALAYLALGFGHNFLPSDWGWKALFVAAVILWTIFALQDSVLIGLRASKWVAVENIAFSVAKLVLLPVSIAVSASQGIFAAWTAPVILTIIVITWYLFRKRIPEHMAMGGSTEKLPSTRELFVLAGAQYAATLSSVFMPSIITLIVIERLGAVANAYYYIPSMIATGLSLVCLSVVRSFLVEASHEPHALRHHANSAIRAMVLLLTPSIVIGFLFAPEFLKIFGASYANHGTVLMRMLLLAVPGSAVMYFYSTFAWLDQRVWWMTVRNVFGLVLQLVLIFVLIDSHGIDAIGIAMLVNSALTLVLFLPASIRRYRLTDVQVT